MTRLTVCAALVLCVFARSSNAWNAAGHMAVTLIAWQQLKPATRAKLTAVIAKHPSYAKWKAAAANLPADDADAFVLMQASVWPDEIRSRSDLPEEYRRPDAHFINAFIRQPADQPAPKARADNILKKLDECAAGLKDADTEAVRRAEDLAWILHLLGDIHQPLHCVALVTPKFPQGDLGGNNFHITVNARRYPRSPRNPRFSPPNLHSFWDSALGDGSGMEDARKVAQRATVNTRVALAGELAVEKFAAWADEGTQVAEKDVYRFEGAMLPYVTRKEWQADDTLEIPAFPKGYTNRARTVAARRLALAGYRLADLLQRLCE